MTPRLCATYVAACLLMLGATLPQAQTRPEAPAQSPLADRLLPMEAIVNGTQTGSWLFVERQGELYAPREALDEWRVQERTGATPITVRGGEYFPLRAIPGFEMKVNFSTQTVDIRFSPDAFAATRLTQQLAVRPPLSPVLPSTFLNYDINLSASNTRLGSNTRDVGALLEFGFSNDWGVFTSTHVGRDLTGNSPDRAQAGWRRLETTFTRNLPQRNLTLRVGDAVTRQGLWGRNVYFGGVQAGTNFELSPGLLTQPLPILGGVSTAASTVELYVNDVLRRVSQVPAGPFVIDNNVGLTGSGEARLVVRDVLGREVVIVQPFFTSAQLLAPGLDDWSVEAGAVRENLGLVSDDYGHFFGAGTWRRGISDTLTLEGRAELARDFQTVGFGGIVALPANVLARAAIARSRHLFAGSGTHWLVGLERQWTRTSFNMQASGATRQYRELGFGDELPIRLQWGANLSHSFSGSNLGLGIARIARYDLPTITTVSANYSMRVGRESTLSFSLGHVIGPGEGTSVGVSLHVPLDENKIVTVTANSREGTHDLYATASRTGSLENDFGWRVLGGQLQNEAHAEAGVHYGGRFGRVWGDVSASRHQTSLRAGAAGGLVYTANRFFPSRRVDQSFAVVEVKGLPDVGVGIGGNVMTTTNAEGIALVPYLSPYQANQIRLDARDLPISAEIENIERIAVPAWRSAVKVDFPVRSGKAAVVKVQLENGEPVPPGAVARIQGDQEEFYFGRRGEAFLTGLQPRNTVSVEFKGQTCRFQLELPASNDEILRIGPYRCSGVRR